MGGIAFRAPVLAALFLIVALATLAMPGSANFVGEFLILLGVFQAKLVDRDRRLHRRRDGERLRAAAVHPRDAQPRRRGASTRARSRSRDGAVLVPLVARDPRSWRSTRSWPAAPSERHAASAGHAGRAVTATRSSRDAATAHVKGPHIDFAGALAADRAARRRGGRADGRPARAALGPCAARAGAQPRRARRGDRADDLAVERGASRSSRARCRSTTWRSR